MRSGEMLGPYRVEEKLGEGGMGEVYKARDTRLDRTVAIKVLPPGVSGDPERRARFEREAKTVASLNHSHICTLYDVGEHGGSTFLVMEHIVGQTLAARLEKGQLPLQQALTVATEIAEALSAAHRQSVIHRDLKPGNVMLTKAGAKLLDFGLAKLTGHGEQPAASYAGSSLPTQTATLTGQGVIVGTLQYMAPEQLEGKSPDARTDLWALGAILYEMLTGKRAFQGTSAVSLMAAIMDQQPPPIATLQPLTPPALDRLVTRCLAKDPEARWQTALDLAAQLRWLTTNDAARGAQAPGVPRWRLTGGPSLALAGALVLVIGIALGGAVARRLASSGTDAQAAKLMIWVGDAGLTLLDGGVAVSPNGRMVVFQARSSDRTMLYVRHLNEWTARPLAGTEGASEPFFSPDGDWVAYRPAEGGFAKLPIGGGTPQAIWRSAAWTTGAVWTRAGEIIFGRWPETGLWTVTADGGTPRPLYRTTGEGDWCLWPEVLPGEKAVLFTVWRAGRMFIAALPLPAGDVRPLLDPGAGARYVSTGHLVYESEGTLFAVRFDPLTLQKGAARAVVPDIGRTRFGGSWRQSGRGRPYDVSPAGTLAYGTGVTSLSRLVWRDRTGKMTATPLSPRAYNLPALSPDGRRVVDTIYDGAARSLWISDVDAEAMHPLTRGPDDCFSLFSPDGRAVLFTRNDNGRYNLHRVRADGAGEPELVVDSPESKRGTSFTPDGRTVLFNRRDASGGMDIWEWKDGVSRPLVASPASERDGQVSPDGRWFVYAQSDAGAKPQIFVRAYPDGGPEQISFDGGVGPSWSRDGGELFYQQQSRGVMAVRLKEGRRLAAPTMLFAHESDYRDWDVSPDGKRFLVVEPADEAGGRGLLNVITNWGVELERMMPARR